MTIKLFYTVRKIEDVSEFKHLNCYALNIDWSFDVRKYAEYAGIHDLSEFDAEDIHAVQDAQSKLQCDEWIFIDHE